MTRDSQQPPTYVERGPRPELASVVTRLWFLDVPTRGPVEWILPIPAVHAIVNLGEPYAVLRRGVEPVDLELGAGFVSGLQRRYLVNRNPARLRHVGAQLHPCAFAALGMEPFADEVRPAAASLPGLDGVRDAIAADAGAEPALDALEEALAVALAAAPGAVDDVAAAAADAIAAQPDVRIGALAERIGVSPNTLTRRFRAATGVTPKSFADVARFHAFLTRLGEPGPLPTWTELVADTSYFDQAHFIRTFTRFAGLSPREYLRILGEEGRVEPSFLYPDRG